MPVVREIRGLKRYFGGSDQPGWLPPEAAVPHAVETVLDLQIRQEKEGFFLVSGSSHPHFSGGDTLYKTLEDAIAQAKFEFGVTASEWKSPANT